MKKEWKDWFIESNGEVGSYDWEDRKYTYKNIHKSQVPFHQELKQYIYSLDEVTKDTDYDVYHVHTWKEGEFFGEHIDNNFKRKWAYVCELQPSECNTSLLVEGEPLKEGIFDSNTKHEVPKIQKGIRISLTVFGSRYDTLI